jgi:predicted transcriptional regulator
MTMQKLLEWRHLCVSPSSSILEVAQILQEASARIVLVVDSDDKLLGIVTDGDIRRGLLAGVSSDESCEKVLNSSPRVVGLEVQLDEAIRLTSDGEAGAIPIVSEIRDFARRLGYSSVPAETQQQSHHHGRREGSQASPYDFIDSETAGGLG